ncbi:MAG: RNA methyltransferase [Prevotella sp.]|nr:RNA methyltransferase [Prevotella sp.]
MIEKNLIKYIRSLELKKNRSLEGVFVVETPKVVNDFMEVFSPKRLLATSEWFSSLGRIPKEEDRIITEIELQRISFLQHPQQVIAIFDIPRYELDLSVLSEELCLALDGVRDPGNLGTIIRIADWFGIKTILLSTDSVDAYNPKVVQASMGSLAHVNVIYLDLFEVLTQIKDTTPIYVTTLEGQNLYQEKLTSKGVIVMGNETRGVSPQITSIASKKLLIPSFKEDVKADSLNVAIATALTCAEFRRRDLF